MKATIEFDLSYESDDRYDFETFIKMNKYRRFVEELEDKLRSHNKHGAPFDAELVQSLLTEFVYDE